MKARLLVLSLSSCVFGFVLGLVAGDAWRAGINPAFVTFPIGSAIALAWMAIQKKAEGK